MLPSKEVDVKCTAAYPPVNWFTIKPVLNPGTHLSLKKKFFLFVFVNSPGQTYSGFGSVILILCQSVILSF